MMLYLFPQLYIKKDTSTSISGIPSQQLYRKGIQKLILPYPFPDSSCHRDIKTHLTISLLGNSCHNRYSTQDLLNILILSFILGLHQDHDSVHKADLHFIFEPLVAHTQTVIWTQCMIGERILSALDIEMIYFRAKWKY